MPKDIDVIYANERMIAVGGFLARRWNLQHIWHVRSFAEENKTRYAFFYERMMETLSDRIILISDALYQSFKGKVSEQKFITIHNGVEIKKYTIAEKESDRLYTFFGRSQ